MKRDTVGKNPGWVIILGILLVTSQKLEVPQIHIITHKNWRNSRRNFYFATISSASYVKVDLTTHVQMDLTRKQIT